MRLSSDRREAPERRGGSDRRSTERRRKLALVPVERRSGVGRREDVDRRVEVERRRRETTEEHVRNALQLLVSIVERGSLDDELRRDLDAAILRLRFAVDQLRRGAAERPAWTPPTPPPARGGAPA